MLFIKINATYINFDNVANFWFQRKKEEWNIKGKPKIKYRYFINIEYLGYKHIDTLEFQTNEELFKYKKLLERLLLEDIQYKDE